MKKLCLIVLLVSSLTSYVKGQDHEIGYWQEDARGLPYFSYTGKIPFSATLKNGKKVKLSPDPWFLLGNYRFKLFTHVSGEYEMLTGERAWGRMNQGNTPNSGVNNATLEIRDKKGDVVKLLPLTGMQSLATDPVICKRNFGCGFSAYNYTTNNLLVDRVLSVKPSTNPYNGTSAFLLTVIIKNTGPESISLAYNESVTANYEMIRQQRLTPEYKKVKYEHSIFKDTLNKIIGMHMRGITNDPLLFPSRAAISKYEGFPPDLFMKSITPHVALMNFNDQLTARYEFSLKPNEEKVIHLVIGYTFENKKSSIEEIAKTLFRDRKKRPVIDEIASESAFADDWLGVLPKFDHEKDAGLKRELIWHAYVLETMATYSEFFKETKIPQGTVYDFDWGIHASARDNFQHALPLVYYNKPLAKSVLKYMLKRTTEWGEIKLTEEGYGYLSNSSYFASDQQLFFFMLLSAYLRVTGDYGFLNEKITHQPAGTVLDYVGHCFTFLRDEIGTGAHGLVRLMNSDWNDAVFYIINAPYNAVVYKGESHMNTAMAASVLPDLILQLKKAKTTKGTDTSLLGRLSQSMENYRSSVVNAFMKDLGDRTFPRRMYFNGKAYGEENMFLEPQGYTLMMNEYPVEKKRKLYAELVKRLYAGEKLGAREQELPEFEDQEFDKGSRENGGFWWALNGPVILGVATFDRTEAMNLLKKMTFARFAGYFPHYWTSYWSAADNVESSLIPEEGLPDQTGSYADEPVYCAHPHAWILYCYYVINERR